MRESRHAAPASVPTVKVPPGRCKPGERGRRRPLSQLRVWFRWRTWVTNSVSGPNSVVRDGVEGVEVLQVGEPAH